MAGIIVLTSWPIRGDFVPQEYGGNLTLTALFENMEPLLQQLQLFHLYKYPTFRLQCHYVSQI